MRLYGHPLSPSTRAILFTLAEKDRTADLVPIDLFANEQKTAAHVARQPFGLIPVLDDDGFVLYESRAILRYVDARVPGPRLTPAAPRDAARMDQWMSVDQSYVAPFTRALAIERLVKKHEGHAPDAAAERAAEDALASALAVIDRALAEGRPYLAGRRVDARGRVALPYVAALPLVSAEHVLADAPNVRAWSASAWAHGRRGGGSRGDARRRRPAARSGATAGPFRASHRQPTPQEHRPMTTALDAERYINLETFRKDGSGVKTPVWAAALDGKLVVMTDGTSYKVKRLRNNPKVRVAACSARGDVRGPWHEGTCRVLDADGSQRAEAALKGKYGLQYKVLNFFSRLGGRYGRRAYLEVTVGG